MDEIYSSLGHSKCDCSFPSGPFTKTHAGGRLLSIIIKNECNNYDAILHHSYTILRHEQKAAQLKMMALYIQACNC